MKFQYISDLHLEFLDNNIINIQPISEYLLLAGDIGYPTHSNYVYFLDDVSKKFKKVFIITGNHEYYNPNMSMEQTEKTIRELCLKYHNIYFLQNEFYDFPDNNISIFGSTLWTYINPIESYEISSTLGDYKYIPEFTTRKCIELHCKAIKTFNILIADRKDREIIILVHHIPHTDLIDPKFSDSHTNSAYATDVECFTSIYKNIKAVVYGHTHFKKITGKYYCNPVGYKGENKPINLEASFEI